MIDGYEHLKDIGRLGIRTQEQGKSVHFLLVYFTLRNTTRSYRVTWKKELGRFVQCTSLNRFRHECKPEFQILTHELMNSSLFKNA